MHDTTHRGTYEVFLLKFYVAYKSLKSWRNYDVIVMFFCQVAMRHSLGFIVPSEALGRITFTLFFQGPDP